MENCSYSVLVENHRVLRGQYFVASTFTVHYWLLPVLSTLVDYWVPSNTTEQFSALLDIIKHIWALLILTREHCGALLILTREHCGALLILTHEHCGALLILTHEHCGGLLILTHEHCDSLLILTHEHCGALLILTLMNIVEHYWCSLMNIVEHSWVQGALLNTMEDYTAYSWAESTSKYC